MKKRRTASWYLVFFVTLRFTAVSILALDPSKPPGHNFDLSHWKLTLPDEEASEISAAQLEAGSTNLFFSTGADGAMVFVCPVTGGTTSNSRYPRCELREQLDPGADDVNWTAQGTHSINAQCRVTQIPSSKKTIIGQIHSFSGNASPMIKLQFNGGTVEALVKASPNSGEDTHFTFAEVGLSNLISYQIKVVEGLLSMTVNGSNHSVNLFQTDPAWTNQTLYFKAGNYCQDNSGETKEGAVVAFYQLRVEHSGVSKAPPRLSNQAFDPAGPFSFTVLGQNGANYIIQASTDLTTWSRLLITNAVPGRFDYSDATAPAEAKRFYRVLPF